MLKFEGTDKIRDIKYEDGYVDKIYYDNNTQLVFTSDKEKTGVDEVQFKGRKLVDVTSYGKCEQNGTPTPDTPVDIVCNNGVLKFDNINQEIYADGTVETINVHGKNLFDIATAQILFKSGLVTATKTETGYVLENPNTEFNFILVGIGTVDELDGKTITASCSADRGYNFIYSNADGSNRSYINATTMTISKVAAGGRTNVSVRLTANSSQGTSFTYNNIQVERGSTATDYAPYYNGGTATTEMLLKVGDYQDQQEIIDGTVTRNVGVKVFDGTEAWIRSDQSGFMYIDNLIQFSTGAPLCSHYLGTTRASASGSNKIRLAISGSNYRTIIYASLSDYQTAESFKQWLADQYNAGTPVIVVYPLATLTTEQVQGQQLAIQQGNNTIEITQASIDDIQLKVKYK